MTVANEYYKLIDRLQKEQRELYILKYNLGIFSWFQKSQLNNLIKEYDKAIYRLLLETEQVLKEEYDFLQKLKEA